MLTSAQKIAAYQYAIDNYKGGYINDGICWYIASWLLLNDESELFRFIGITTSLSDIYPEIYAQKPDNADAFWWPLDGSGRLIRIDVLTKAIANVKL